MCEQILQIIEHKAANWDGMENRKKIDRWQCAINIKRITNWLMITFRSCSNDCNISYKMRIWTILWKFGHKFSKWKNLIHRSVILQIIHRCRRAEHKQFDKPKNFIDMQNTMILIQLYGQYDSLLLCENVCSDDVDENVRVRPRCSATRFNSIPVNKLSAKISDAEGRWAGSWDSKRVIRAH